MLGYKAGESENECCFLCGWGFEGTWCGDSWRETGGKSLVFDYHSSIWLPLASGRDGHTVSYSLLVLKPNVRVVCMSAPFNRRGFHLLFHLSTSSLDFLSPAQAIFISKLKSLMSLKLKLLANKLEINLRSTHFPRWSQSTDSSLLVSSASLKHLDDKFRKFLQDCVPFRPQDQNLSFHDIFYQFSTPNNH
jgi:hypothetical protein